MWEAGAHTQTNKPIIIGMDPKYSRRQDVEIQTKLVRPDIKIVYNIPDLIAGIIQLVGQPVTETTQIFRSAVRLAKQKKDDYYTGGFDIMKKLFKKQHKHQDIKHQSAVRESPTSKLEWEARYEHNRDVQAAWCESEGIPVPKEKEYGVLEKVPGYWKSFKANLFWPALKKRGHDKVEYALCKCCHDKSGFGKNYIKRVILP